MNNTFYREPLNTSAGKEYYYIYVFAADNTTTTADSIYFIPDSIVFVLLTILTINLIIASPANIFVLFSIAVEKHNLRRCKMVFITMISVAHLLCCLVFYPTSIAALTLGVISKARCKVVGTIFFYTHVLKLWAVAFLGTLTVIKYFTKHRPTHRRIKRLFTSAGAVWIAGCLLFFSIAFATGILPFEPGWESIMFTCMINMGEFAKTALPSGEKTFSSNFIRVVLIIIIGIPYFLCMWGSAIYLTYKKVYRYSSRDETTIHSEVQEAKADQTPSPKKRSAGVHSSEASFLVDEQVRNIFQLANYSDLITHDKCFSMF